MEKRELMFAIGFATIVLFLLVGFLLFFFLKYRLRKNKFINEREIMQKAFAQTLLQSQSEVQEATFSALSKELHDNVGQLLSSSKMLLGISQRKIAVIPESLIIAEETLGKAIQELRSLSKSLDKEWLQQFNLIDNLNTEIRRINSGLVLEIHFSYQGKLLLSSEQQIILFRIIQEALQNAIRHSEAKNINIDIETNAENIVVKIADDGKGVENNLSNGLGIRNMKYRTKLLGGDITWHSPGKGSLITIQLPAKENHNEHENKNRNS